MNAGEKLAAEKAVKANKATAAKSRKAAGEPEPKTKPEKKSAPKNGNALAGLDNAGLAAHLLRSKTISDERWASIRTERGLPDREDGEKRDVFIRRVFPACP